MSKKRKYSVLIIIMLLCLMFSNALYSKAAAPGSTSTADMGNGYYIVYRPDGQKHITIQVDEKTGSLTFVGEHHRSGSRISYWTMGYFLTLTPANGKLSSYKNKARINLTGEQQDQEDENNNLIITTYKIDGNEVIEACLALGATADDLAKGQKVYMSNIFRTIGREEGAPYNKFWYRSDEIYDLKKMQNAEWWSNTTKYDILPCYYDVELTIKINPHKYEVVYEDENGNVLETPLQNQNVLQSETIKYTIPTDDYTIEKDGKTYECAKKFYVTYENGTETTKKDTGYKITYKYTQPSNGTIHIIYKETDKPSATPTPIPDPNVPVSESISQAITKVSATGVIKADEQDAELFDVTLGIPTTESLYTEVNTKDYLIGYNLVKRTGLVSYPVKVEKTYYLEWEETTYPTDPDEEPTTYTAYDTVTITRTVTIKRTYAYWEIQNLDVYQLASATVKNYALPNESVTLTPKHYTPPVVTLTHSSDLNDHIVKPDEVSNTITLPSETLWGGDYRPTVPYEDFTSDVDAQIGQIKVKNDALTFNGSTIMDNTLTEKEGLKPNTSAIQPPKDCAKNTLYINKQVIDAEKLNETYYSTGTVTYRRVAAVSPNYSDTLTYQVEDINEVVIHTPVYCEAEITSDNNRFVQLLEPTDYVALVLDPGRVTCDFTVRINNYGTHNDYPGYGTRDYSQSLRDPAESYIASFAGKLQNEVKFPFDVYLDIGTDGNTSNDQYIPAGEWYTIGQDTYRFYIPLWTPEGMYTAEFRTVAVNAVDLSGTEPYYNADIFNYVATDSIEFEVSGRMYGLTIYDVSDYPTWQDVFRVSGTPELKSTAGYPAGTGTVKWDSTKSYDYAVGTRNQYGTATGRNVKYTFPLVAGSHPSYSNIGVLKTGYLVRYRLETVGDYDSDASKILIRPSFYYVDRNGQDRKEVDLYYGETINGSYRHLVKVGGALDAVNMKQVTVGDRYLSIPTAELQITAALRNTPYAKLLSVIAPMFTFYDIRLNANFRTYCNTGYTASLPGGIPAGVDTSKLTARIQHWYGEYYLPAEVHAVPKGLDISSYTANNGVDYTEDFWLSDGYLIVNFDIVATDSNGQERLSYINADNYLYNGQCSMWVLEGAPESKTDSSGVTFNWKAGDFIVYDTDKSVSDDYIPGGIY